MATIVRKRSAGVFDGLPTKKARVERPSPVDQTTPSSSHSVPSTDQQSLAETSATSRSTSQRPKVYLCTYDDCDKAFDRPVRLQAHMRTHTDDRPFACEEEGCTKRFYKAEHLKAHVKNKHSDEASHVCGYVFSTSGNGEDVECGKAFTTATRLSRHMAVHESKEELKCKEDGCGQVFRKMETLQRHIKKEHLKEEKSFTCLKTTLDDAGVEEPCAQAFATVGQLKAHDNREHAGNKYFCHVCTDPDTTEPQGFPTYHDLQSHNRTAHPPSCSICGKACESNRDLTAHMDIEHSSLESRQKYVCNYADCGRSFTRQGNLNVHIQGVHVKTKKFVCGEFNLGGDEKCPGWQADTGCGQSFSTKSTLQGHVRTQHLDLPALRRRRQGTKIKDEDSVSTPDSFMDLDEHPSVAPSQTLSLLTGQAYTTTHPLACWHADVGCTIRFKREFDLAEHVELMHGWSVDDINDRFAEDAALAGEEFWVGGEEGLDQMGGSRLDGSDEFVDVGEQEMFDGVDDAMAIDPALTGV